MKGRAKLVLVLAMLVALTSAGWWAYREYRRRQALALIQAVFALPTSKPSWKRDLPPTATEVHEFAWVDGFLPDYTYILKAHITAPEFERFVAGLGLTPHTPEHKYSEDSIWLAWMAPPGFKEDWWDVSPTVEHAFVSEEHNT